MNYDILPEHMREAAREYVEYGAPVGSFLTAVLENNLIEAYKCADDTNTAAMRDWAFWVYDQLPGGAWGSPEAVRSWQECGGLKGLYSATKGD